MEVIYATGEATADDVVEGLADPPTRTAVRTFLGILEEKGLVKHGKRGRAFVYRPTQSPGKVGKGALRQVVETFFGGSLEKALAENPDNHQARFDLALALNAKGQRDEAADALLTIFKRDRKWNDEAARKQLLQFFEAWGLMDPAAVTARRKLSAILF